MKIKILGFNKEKAGEIELVKELVDDKINTGCLYYKYINENSNIHPGTAFKKNRALVSGGGAKPWRQKGTGRARAGTRRSCIFTGGGLSFGNQRKKYKFRLPRKIKVNGITTLFNLKFKQDLVIIINNIKLETPKCRDLKSLLKNLIVPEEKVILVVKDAEENLCMAVRNIKNITFQPVKRLIVRNFINDRKIFMTKDAAEYLNLLCSGKKFGEPKEKIKSAK